MKKTADIEDNASSLADDARELLAATAGMAETKVVEARKRLQSALERGKEAWGDLQERAVEQAKVADEVIRDHPYHSIGVAFGVGALLGVLLGAPVLILVMDTPPDTDAHLAGAIKRILWRAVAIGHNRAELLMLEMQEERARAQMVVFLATGAAVFGMLACVTITAVVACACASHLLLALGLIAAFYCLGALSFCVTLVHMMRRWEAFTSSREQFDKDRECLEKRAT